MIVDTKRQAWLEELCTTCKHPRWTHDHGDELAGKGICPPGEGACSLTVCRGKRRCAAFMEAAA